MDNYSELRPNVGVTVFPVTFKEPENKIMVLTYRRPADAETYSNKLAFPNGFMNIQKHDTLEEAAIDALKEKTGVKLAHFEHFDSFSGAHIDPRRITVNVAFISMHNSSEIEFGVAEHIGEPEWISIDELLELKQSDFAFNHHEVLFSANENLKLLASRTSNHAKMLDVNFSVLSFRTLTEKLIGEKLNPKTFKSKLIKFGVIEDTGLSTKPGNAIMGAPKALYRIHPDHDGTFVPK